MDELRTRHRKEQKELQSRITQKKKNATKKTRKGVNDECERWARELAERQETEIKVLEGDDANVSLDGLTITDDADATMSGDSLPRQEAAKQVRFDDSATTEDLPAMEVRANPKKPNRQKARLARKAAEQEAQIAAAEEEAANLPDLRQQELTSMKGQMDKLNMQETFIRPDGHCLYSACALGIPASDVKSSNPSGEGYRNVRSATADFISEHPDDFSAFLEEPLDTYVKKIRDTAEWGGHLELQAISRAYNVNVNVLQSDGRIERFSPTKNEKPTNEVWLAYYRHSFGLGEHYNALKKIEK